MFSSPGFRPLSLLLPLIAGLAIGLALDVSIASAGPTSGATSGPWRCRAFDLDQTVEGAIADWLYQHAATGPGNVLVLSGADSTRGYVTLCAWDSGFAAAHWLAQEEERRRHEEEVQSRQERIRKQNKTKDGRLFSDDVVEFEESEQKKQGRKKR